MPDPDDIIAGALSHAPGGVHPANILAALSAHGYVIVGLFDLRIAHLLAQNISDYRGTEVFDRIETVIENGGPDA